MPTNMLAPLVTEIRKRKGLPLASLDYPPNPMNESRVMLRVTALTIATRMTGSVRNFENIFAHTQSQTVNIMLTVEDGEERRKTGDYRVTLPFMVTALCSHLNGRV